jgi:hypothetical protein
LVNNLKLFRIVVKFLQCIGIKVNVGGTYLKEEQGEKMNNDQKMKMVVDSLKRLEKANTRMKDAFPVSQWEEEGILQTDQFILDVKKVLSGLKPQVPWKVEADHPVRMRPDRIFPVVGAEECARSYAAELKNMGFENINIKEWNDERQCFEKVD